MRTRVRVRVEMRDEMQMRFEGGSLLRSKGDCHGPWICAHLDSKLLTTFLFFLSSSLLNFLRMWWIHPLRYFLSSYALPSPLFVFSPSPLPGVHGDTLAHCSPNRVPLLLAQVRSAHRFGNKSTKLSGLLITSYFIIQLSLCHLVPPHLTSFYFNAF